MGPILQAECSSCHPTNSVEDLKHSILSHINFIMVYVQCSAKCGSGIQQRDVFCGQASGNDVVTVSDSECDDHHRPASNQNCTTTQCSGVWLAGPFGKVVLFFS